MSNYVSNLKAAWLSTQRLNISFNTSLFSPLNTALLKQELIEILMETVVVIKPGI